MPPEMCACGSLAPAGGKPLTGRDNPWWAPEAYGARRPALLRRAALLRRMRDWFHGEGFVEVETPALQVAAGMEVHVAPFGTALQEPDGRSRALRLHSSPEFAMKKLLVAGEPRLFQFARVFRNGERSATHHPEFTLLEWYRAGAGWRDLIPDCEALLALAGPELRWNGRRVPVAAPFERLSVAAAFRDRLGLDVLAADTGRLAAACRAEGLEPGGADGWEDLFFRLFLNRIEPHLGLARPTVLHGWPARMAALARLDPDDPRVAERFEIYVGGLELANAFGELTDAAEQRRRFEAAARERRALHGDDLPIDEDFLSALEQGMPASAGIALGFDRLAMLAMGADRIEDVLWAPVAAADPEA